MKEHIKEEVISLDGVTILGKDGYIHELIGRFPFPETKQKTPIVIYNRYGITNETLKNYMNSYYKHPKIDMDIIKDNGTGSIRIETLDKSKLEEYEKEIIRRLMERK